MIALIAEAAAWGPTILMVFIGLTVYSQRHRVLHIGIGRAKIELGPPAPPPDSLD